MCQSSPAEKARPRRVGPPLVYTVTIPIGSDWMDNLYQDLRFALRVFSRRPLFTFVAVATLALGIGASTAVFSVVDGVLFWDAPYEDPGQLVSVSGAYKLRQRGTQDGVAEWREGSLSYPEYQRWRDGQTRFDEVAVYSAANMVLTGLDRPERLRVGVASASLLPTLGVRAPLGRWFLPGEDGPGARRVAVLSHGFWQERFGGDPGVLDRTVTLNGESFQVVGVLPDGFRLRSLGGSSASSDSGDRPMWVPMGTERTRLGERDRAYAGLARLSDGGTLDQARPETVALLRGDQDPDARGAFLRYRDELENRGFRSPILIIFAASGILLLIACGNVAALVLAEITGRREELAVRKALGAGTVRLLRQILAESVVLGLAGALAGVGVAVAATRGLLALAPPLPHLDQVGVSGTVLGFGALLGVVTGVLFGLVPLREISAPAGRTPRKSGMEAVILPAQMALTVILLVAGGLLGRSLGSLLSMDPGFEVERVAMIQPQFLGEESVGHDQILTRLGAVPGVEAVGGISSLPFHGFPEDAFIEVVGQEVASEDERPVADRRQVLPGYFETMGIPLLEGRVIDDTDRAGTSPVTVVSEALAREHWPGASALGQQIRFMDQLYTVVGVVGDIRHRSLASDRDPTFYLPVAQYPQGMPTFVIRTAGAPSALLPSLRGAVWELSPDALIRSAESMNTLVARTTGSERFRTGLLGAFGLCALLLASSGVLGVASRQVARRTRELGIRKALGARDGALVGLVVGQTLGLGGIGMGIGLLCALGASRILGAFLFGIEPWDPLTFVGVLSLLGIASTGAAYLPARKASRIEPMRALGGE